MTFLNGLLAFGAAAFSLPLIIHFLNRSRFRTVPWGAMHLLESVVRMNNRRFHIEQIILLIVRCAIPILLAFCLARPVLTGWRSLPGDVPNSTVILLDNSYSMDAEQNNRSVLTTAIDDASAIVNALGRGSDVSVITMGGGPRPMTDAPIVDSQMMTERLKHVQGGYGASRIVESFESALGTLAGMSNARRDLILISDFQRSDWENLSSETLRRLQAQLSDMPIRPSITLLAVGRKIANNLSVDSIVLSTQTPGVGQQLQIRATLRNHGQKTYSGLPVIFRADGAQLEATQITLPARSTTQVLFTHAFKRPGSHLVDVEAVVDDGLKTDNRMTASVPVIQHIKVLLVDGKPSAVPLESGTAFLAVALTPFTLGRTKLSDLIQTRTITVQELNQLALSESRVVVLANVPALSGEQVAQLMSYVRGGGSLLAFSGDQVNISTYNQTLCHPTRGILPMQIEAIAGNSDQVPTSSHIVAQHFDYPALQLFNDRANGNLGDVEIWKWLRLKAVTVAGPSAGSSSSQPLDTRQPRIIARLDNGDPLMVQQRVGNGIVIQVATSCAADWSNFPMRPVYVPLMQQLIATMASELTPPCNIQTGEPLAAILPKEAEDLPLSLTTPDGIRHTIRATPVGNHCVIQFSGTQQPGIYRLTGPGIKPRSFVARTDRTESDLRLVDSDRLDSVTSALESRRVRSANEYLQLDSRRRHGREVWRPLLFGLLLFLFIELVLQRRFAKVPGQ